MRAVWQMCYGGLLAGALTSAAACGDASPHAALCLPAESPPGDGTYCGVVERYIYDFDLRTRRARSTLALRAAASDERCAVVRTRTPLDDVAWNDREATETRIDDGALHACGEASTDVTLEATSSVMTSPTYGVGFTEPVDRFGHRFAYMLGWIRECDRFGPCDVETAPLAHFRFDVSHDQATTVLCPGMRTTAHGHTTCLIDDARAPTYSAYGILASDALVMTPWATTGSVVVERYEVPEGGVGAALDGEIIARFLEYATALFGPLPYGETLRVVAAPVPWLGFEHPANIVISDTVMNVPNLYAHPTRHVLFHEIIHQWAGNRTTLEDAYDFVWKEAIAEYVAYVFEDEHFPADSLTTRRGWDRLARFAAVYPRPTDDPPPSFENVTYDAYGTGPMLLLALEDLVGRAHVIEGIRTFLTEPGARSTRRLFDGIASASGSDLTRFVDTFVFGAGEPDWPVFTITTLVEGDDVIVTATQTVRAGPPRPVVLTVRVAGPTRRVDVVLANGTSPTTNVMSAAVPFDEPVIAIEVDPVHRTIDFPDVGTLAHTEPAPARVRHHP